MRTRSFRRCRRAGASQTRIWLLQLLLVLPHVAFISTTAVIRVAVEMAAWDDIDLIGYQAKGEQNTHRNTWRQEPGTVKLSDNPYAKETDKRERDRHGGETRRTLGSGPSVPATLPFPVYIQYCRFLDHVQNVQNHAMRATFHIVFSVRISDQNALPGAVEAAHSDLRARPEAGTLGKRGA